MGKIAVLNQHLTNMIAAGEVVERPAGIVKELVENSIDAGAKDISVSIRDGGMTYIQVIDNGVGMDSADATMAFERHATSKIRNDNDLWAIGTMGFRGEALPSIASVSQVRLMTNNHNESTSVKIDFGKIQAVTPLYCPEGTQVVVENLFQKTPARLKHLKSKQYEAAVISGVIEKFALSHPEIAFTYNSEGKEVFRSSGNGNIAEILYTLYGTEAARHMVSLEGRDYDYSVTGALVLPSITRATKNYLSIFINSRMIRSFRLQKVILEAFRDYIPTDRYPIVVINVSMDPQLVDVNVHPSKWEIRLSKEQQLEDLIRRSIETCLNTHMKAPEVKVANDKTEKIEFATFKFDEPITPPTLNPSIMASVKEESRVAKEEIEVIETSNSRFPIMSIIGQLHGKYILAEAESGLYIIDQHAAQERFNYERFQKLIVSSEADHQDLLIPLVIETGTMIQEEFNEIEEMLKRIHLEVERFGNDSLLCRKIPVWMKDIEIDAFIRDMIDFYKAEKDTGILTVRKAAIASLACHVSVKFNRRLTLDEMKEVLINLQKCENPFNCPHGRPTFIHLSDNQLKKEFLR